MIGPADAGLAAWCDAARALYRLVLVRSAQRELAGKRPLRRKPVAQLRAQAQRADDIDTRPPDQRPAPATRADTERDAADYRVHPDEARVRAYEEASQQAQARLAEGNNGSF